MAYFLLNIQILHPTAVYLKLMQLTSSVFGCKPIANTLKNLGITNH